MSFEAEVTVTPSMVRTAACAACSSLAKAPDASAMPRACNRSSPETGAAVSDTPVSAVDKVKVEPPSPVRIKVATTPLSSLAALIAAATSARVMSAVTAISTARPPSAERLKLPARPSAVAGSRSSAATFMPCASCVTAIW